MTTEAIIQGVSLARYAAVKAAIIEGFALPDVLAAEELDAPTWKEAEAGWTEKIAHEPAALARYQVALAAAEDCLFRRVAPLEDDPEAWVAFLHAFTHSTEPCSLLAANRLGMNDISRLGRRWARRVEQEPALQKQLAKLARMPGALPRIEVEPAKLRRSRVAEAVQSAVVSVGPTKSSAADVRALDAHRGVLRALAAKRAQVEPEESPPAPVVTAPPAALEFTALPPAMRTFLDVHGTQVTSDPSPAGPLLPFNPHATPQLPEQSGAPAWLPRDMQVLVSVGGTQAPSESPAASSPPFVPAPPVNATELPPGMRGFVDVHGTQLATEESPVGTVLPFEQSASHTENAAPKEPASGSLVPSGMRPFTSLTGTELAPDPPHRAALPFAAAAGSRAASGITLAGTPKSQEEPTSLPPARPELPAGMRGFVDVHGTKAATDTPPVGPKLPFVSPGPHQPSVVPPGMQHAVGPTGTIPASPVPQASVPKGMRHFKTVSGTEIMPELGQRTVRPFPAAAQSRTPGMSDAPSRAPIGVQSSVRVDGTRDAVDAPARSSLPFVPPKANTPPPIAGSAIPSNAPQITLEQHAQICVELALYPAHKIDILRRYGIDEEQRCGLDGYWGARVRADPSMRTAWNRHYVEHWTRLRGQQANKG